MIKHEYQNQNENGTAPNEPRNIRPYDAALIASEKNRMKMLDSKKEADANAIDVVQYATRDGIPAVHTGSFFTTNVYPMGNGKADKPNHSPKTDLEKHIYESERYYKDITNSTPQATETKAEDKFRKPVPTTMEISAFEPKNMAFPDEETMSTSVFQNGAKATGEAITAETAAQQTRAFQSYASEPLKDWEKLEGLNVSEDEEEEKAPEQKKAPQQKEYTDVSQNKEFYMDMRSKCVLSRVRIAMAILLCLSLFVIENIPAVKAGFAKPLVYIVVDWILAFSCALLVFDRLRPALKALLRMEPEADCITLVAFCLSLAATAFSLIVETPAETVSLYNFPFAVCVLFDTLFIYWKLRRDLYSFSILSSLKNKRAVVLTEPEKKVSSEEEEAHEPEVDQGEIYGKIKDVNFVEGFFAHKNEHSGRRISLKIILLFCLCISVAFFFCALFFMHHTVADSIVVAYATFMMCAPFSAFLVYSFPMYLAARRMYTYRSAILCDKTPDLYQDISMLVFRDTEVFSSEQAKVKSIRLYADKKIDNAIYYASGICSAIGGPLAGVFQKAALNSVNAESVNLIEICAEGACAMIDGKNIVIGTPSYMEEQCFETVNDPGDEEYEGKTNKRIFYLACDQIVIAKFYIQYTVRADFLEIANRLFAAGIGIGVSTADPCLDVGIFYENKINPEQNAIRVLKGCMEEPAEESVPANKAGVISTGSTMDLVKAVLICGKLENVKKTHLVLKVVSSILGVAVMALILFTGKAPEMGSVYPALYQLFWLLPVYFVSKVYL